MSSSHAPSHDPLLGLETSRLGALLDGFPQRRLLIVGDCMLDEYLWGASNRTSPEGPVMVVELTHTTYAAGGASNVAANIVRLEGKADIVAIVGRDASADRLRHELDTIGVGLEGLVTVEDRPTTVKTRIMSHNQQVVRVDRELRTPAPPPAEELLIACIEAAIDHCDGVIFSDYAKGVLTGGVVAATIAAAKERGKPLFANAKPVNIQHFRGLDLVSVNQAEAEAITGLALRDTASVEAAAAWLIDHTGCASAMVTRGGDGLTLLEAGRPIRHIPALRQEVFDVAGAGDSVIAAAALARVSGARWQEAAIIANFAGHAKVRKRGVVPVSRAEIRAVERLARNGRHNGSS